MNIIGYEDWASYGIDGVWDMVGLDLGCIPCGGRNLTGQLRSSLVQHCTNKRNYLLSRIYAEYGRKHFDILSANIGGVKTRLKE
jgi:hypothetical protein